MNLRNLSSLSVAAALIGLLVLGAFSIASWNTLSEHKDRLDELSGLRIHVEQVNAGIDYVTLLRSDPDVLRALGEDARDLAEGFRAFNHPLGAPAVIHLDEMVHLSEVLAEVAPHASLLYGDEAQRDTLLTVSRQLLVHRSGVIDVLNSITSEEQRSVYQGVMGVVATLTVGALALVSLAMIGFTIIHRRLSGPLAAVEHGLRAVAAGDLNARIDVTGHDELARLSTEFNHMVAQRRAHEQALKDSEERFRQLTENIDVVFWMTEPHRNRLLYVSPAFEEIWGIPCDTLYHSPDVWLEAIHEDDRERLRTVLWKQAEGTYDEEYRVVRPDGSVRNVVDRAFPITNEYGEVYRIAGVAQDITQRRHLEFDLRERVKELRCLHRVLELSTNPGLSNEEVCQQIADFLPEGLSDPEQGMARIVMEGAQCNSPGWCEPRESLRSPLFVNGKEYGFVEVGYGRDATRSPAAEGFLFEEQTLVDGVAKHLSRMLLTRQLSEAMSQSERLSAVGQLTGGVAHDFNNLLTVIIGNAELLQLRMAKDDPVRALADMIDTAAQRGAELTRRLLAFARSQALEPRAVNVNELLAGMEKLLHRTLGEDIALSFVQEQDIWPAMIDPGQLENAILNLCLNARDAMPDGGTITLETGNTTLDQHYADTHTEVRAGEYVMVSVTDNGTGIPAHILDRVFDPFFTTKGQEKGTGLGLSMVHGFAKQSNGHISIYSEEGEGTTVRIYLPRADSGEDVAQATGPDHYSMGGDEVILLVEDDRLVRRYAEEQLSALGYMVLVAGNASDALEMIHGHPGIDLLFTDVVMPGGMNGRELADAARAIRPKLKVLYTSGYTRNAIVHQGRLDAGILLLPKPYRQIDLARKIREALEQP